MVKIFTPEEQKEMGEVFSEELKAKYPNKAFIMINTKNNYINVNGKKCMYGIRGTLYSMVDYKDSEEYGKIMESIYNTDEIDNVGTFTNFEIRNGVLI